MAPGTTRNRSQKRTDLRKCEQGHVLTDNSDPHGKDRTEHVPCRQKSAGVYSSVPLRLAQTNSETHTHGMPWIHNHTRTTVWSRRNAGLLADARNSKRSKGGRTLASRSGSPPPILQRLGHSFLHPWSFHFSLCRRGPGCNQSQRIMTTRYTGQLTCRLTQRDKFFFPLRVFLSVLYSFPHELLLGNAKTLASAYRYKLACRVFSGGQRSVLTHSGGRHCAFCKLTLFACDTHALSNLNTIHIHSSSFLRRSSTACLSLGPLNSCLAQ